MIEIRSWLKREFSFDQPIDAFPGATGTIKGTPARAKELVAGVSEGKLSTRSDGQWSVKDHLGHLVEEWLLGSTQVREMRAYDRDSSQRGNSRKTGREP